MASITIEIIDHIVLLFLVAFVPWNGHRRFRKLTEAVAAGEPNARKRFYLTTLLGKWNLAGVVAAAWVILSRSPESIGAIAEFGEPRLVPLAGFALTAVAIGGLLVYARAAIRSEQIRSKTRQAIDPVRGLLPHTASEKRWFDCVSVTAGVTEEFVYRGFLFAYLPALIPGMPAGVIVIVAALAFGLGHAYQGPAGIAKTATLGTLFGGLYWMTGSLLAPMLLHAGVDLTSGWINWRLMRGYDTTATAAPAPA